MVGVFNHLEKYEFVNGKDDIPYNSYIMENSKKCFSNHQPDDDRWYPGPLIPGFDPAWKNDHDP
jgi:hypothetical protein